MNERIVALDVGDRRIGIAVSDALGITAQPIETYTRVGYGPDVRRICQIAQQYETNRILCGLPLNMDGSRGFQAEKVAQLAEKLEEAGLVVSYYDERMTTVLAEDALIEANMSRENRKKKVDMVAAVMILQSYLDAQAMQSASVDADADDSDEDDGVLEMEDEDGNVIRFLLNATIPYHGEEYVLLVSEEACGDIEQDESFIMRKATDEDGNPCFQSLDDEKLIERIYEQYETNRILCGLPLNMDGSRGFQAEKVAQLAEKLEEAGLVVSYYDERMTTVLAEDALIEANMSRENRKKKVDMVAAVMILQSYLDAQAMQSASVDADADDSDEDDGVLEMEDEDGNVIRFLLNATIPYHGEEYVLLVSEEACGDIEQDESFIMRKATDEDGNPCFQSLDDEKLIERIYEAYLEQSEEH